MIDEIASWLFAKLLQRFYERKMLLFKSKFSKNAYTTNVSAEGELIILLHAQLFALKSVWL